RRAVPDKQPIRGIVRDRIACDNALGTRKDRPISARLLNSVQEECAIAILEATKARKAPVDCEIGQGYIIGIVDLDDRGSSIRCILKGGNWGSLQEQMIEGHNRDVFLAGAGHEDRDSAGVSRAREARKRAADAATFAAVHPDGGRIYG